MKKKILATLMAGLLAVTMLAGCGGGAASSAAEAPAEEKAEEAPAEEKAEEAEESFTSEPVGDDTIKIWVPDAIVDFTKEQAEKFLSGSEYSNYKVVVEAVGEGDAAGNMVTDVTAGADIFNFAQDQIARLVSAGALEEVAPDNVEAVKSGNDAGAVGAATVGGTIYAYPITSDNGYFLYYDKSVVTDPTSLEKILADCEAAGKNFYFELNSGWYQTAFFFATGANLTYDTDDAGNFTACNINYASPEGLVALKKMVEVASSKAFQNGSSVGQATDIGAIVDGVWDSDPAQELFGDNYACAKLPTFKGADGKDYQMSGFGGFKLLGVKPQTDENKLAACDALAAYLSSEEVQLARFDLVGWGPSNLNAQQSDAVKANPALAALAEQLAFTIPQGNYPGDYWTLATGLGDDIRTGKLTTASSDDELMSALQKFQDTCISYAK
ncbi:MAG: extracellular solute-binding protein [Lachnospiraceae bacterium]|nr:extracellular solute-binding protein [Lachnospiraceae bacterium]